MAEEKIIKAEKREATGTGEARRLRRAGKTPGVVYGDGDTLLVAMDSHEFGLMIRDFGSNFIGDLVIDGAASRKVLIKDVQHNPISGDIIHADFVAVSMTETIQVSLPIELHGEAAGVVTGGVMEQILSEMEIECLPGNMVESIIVDVSDMQIGDTLSVGDIKLAEGIKSVGDPDLVVVSIAAPRVIAKDEGEEEEAAAEGAEAAAAE
jgi:large subunit ribosomal protein L25